jgi:2,3-bisphosphoglycerate-dependent phosphoglycerate mutase
MAKLILLRHIKSQWNEENRFTGWVDVPLDKKEVGVAKDLFDKVFKNQIDKIYSSPLFRNKETVVKIFEYENKKYPIFVHLDKGKMKEWGRFKDISQNDVPVYITEALNERYYGKLQGENKETTSQKYGKEKVYLWRRGYQFAPPGGENLKQVFKRTSSFFKKYIEKDLNKNENVLVVASHNSLRAIAKYVEKIGDREIINFEIPYGGMIEYNYSKGVYKKANSY